MKTFTSVSPKSVKEAVDLLGKGNATAVGGGSDLLGMVKEHLVSPDVLVNDAQQEIRVYFHSPVTPVPKSCDEAWGCCDTYSTISSKWPKRWLLSFHTFLAERPSRNCRFRSRRPAA